MRRTSPILLLAAVAALPACQGTASGRALGHRTGRSLSRLLYSSAKLFEGTPARATGLLATASSLAGITRPRLASMLYAGRRQVAAEADRLATGTLDTVRVVRNIPGDTSTRVANFVRTDGPFLRTLGPGVMLRRLFDGTVWFLGHSDLSRPILPGRGDPDRSTATSATTRARTYIERLLDRF